MTDVREKRTRRTVWKYPFSLLQDEFRLEMPKGARVLHVDIQGIGGGTGHPQPCMWVEVDLNNAADESTYETKTFRIVGTGHPFEDVELVPVDKEEASYKAWVDTKWHEYVGTFQMLGGTLVWHLYEVGSEEIPEDINVLGPEDDG